jgi:hypothetical protein
MTKRLVPWLMIAVLATLPALRFAGDDVAVHAAAKHQHARLARHHHGTSRTVASTSTPRPLLTAVAPGARLAVVTPVAVVPLLVRVPFVPPRG